MSDQDPKTETDPAGGGDPPIKTRNTTGDFEGDDDDQRKGLELQFGARFIDLDTAAVDPEAVVLVPWPMMRKLDCAPIGIKRRRMMLAMPDPNDFAAFDTIKALVESPIQVFVCTREAFERYLSRIEIALSSLGPRPQELLLVKRHLRWLNCSNIGKLTLTQAANRKY